MSDPAAESARTGASSRFESHFAPRSQRDSAVESSDGEQDESEAPVAGRSSPAWLGLGFLVFGFALGEVAGFSVVQGISQTLLSALFTFVGGVLLTFAGFKVRARAGSARAYMDPVRTGVALGCFSFGVVLGTNFGVMSRCNVHFERFFLGESVEHSMCNGIGPFVSFNDSSTAAGSSGLAATGIGPQSGAATECQKRRRDIDVDLGTCQDPAKLREEFSQFAEQCGKP